MTKRGIVITKHVRGALDAARSELGPSWELGVEQGGKHNMLVATRGTVSHRIPMPTGGKKNAEMCREMMRRYCRQLLRGSRAGVVVVG